MKNTEHFQLISNAVPHVAEKLELFWGTEFFSEYVNKLMLDTRDGTRQGFPRGVGNAIAALLKMHEEQYPSKVKHDPWDIRYKW